MSPKIGENMSETAISVISSRLAVWKNYELRMARKNEKLHVARTFSHAAYFLYTSQDIIDTIIKENNWDNLERRDSFRIWLIY